MPNILYLMDSDFVSYYTKVKVSQGFRVHEILGKPFKLALHLFGSSFQSYIPLLSFAQERKKSWVAKEDDARDILGSWGKHTSQVKLQRLTLLAILSLVSRFTTNQFYWEPSHSFLPVLASLFLPWPCTGQQLLVLNLGS